jgi:hypothetical protein
MQAIRKIAAAIALTTCIAGGATAANAATVYTQLNQPALTTFGTSDFGAIITSTGAFDHAFAFETFGLNDASSFIGTISLANGNKDIDFSSIDLDGLFFFTKTSGDPSEHWDLSNAVIGAGIHSINVHGNVVAAGPGQRAASYSGTLNLSPVVVPEPATWGLMIMGFGGVGAMIRTRRRVAGTLA